MEIIAAYPSGSLPTPYKSAIQWAFRYLRFPETDDRVCRDILRARISGSHVDVSFYVNNVLNAQPLLLGKTEGSSYGVVFGPPLVYGVTFRPRTVGVALGMHF